MPIKDQLQVATSRCLSLLKRYEAGERTTEAKAEMVAEVEVIIGWLMELNLPSGATRRGLLWPVQDDLITLYGHEEGQRLNKEFAEVFEGPGMPLIFQRKYYQKLVGSYA